MAIKASAPPRSPLAGLSWSTVGRCGGTAGRSPTSDAARMEPCVPLDAREAWQAKDVPATRLHPELPSRAVVARLTDSTPIELPPPLSGLPPARDQQQLARRLAEAGRKREVERI